MRTRDAFKGLLSAMSRDLHMAMIRIDPSVRWLFVLGCYNSGTTLLHNLIAMHPGVGSMPDEGQHYSDMLPSDYEKGVPRLWTYRDSLFRMTEDYRGDIDAVRLQKEWLLRMNRRTPVALEKTITDCARMRWYDARFTNPSFICLSRHPCAVAEGIRRKTIAEGVISLDAAATQWQRNYASLKQDAESVSRVLWLRYEDLVSDTPGVMQQVFEFIGLQPLDNSVFEGEVSVFGSPRAIQDDNQRSFARLSEAEKHHIWKITGELAATLGYEEKC